MWSAVGLDFTLLAVCPPDKLSKISFKIFLHPPVGEVFEVKDEVLAVPALLEEETERISLITSATPCIKVFAKKLFVVAGAAATALATGVTAATAVAAFCVARVCTVGKETTAVSVCVFQL